MNAAALARFAATELAWRLVLRTFRDARRLGAVRLTLVPVTIPDSWSIYTAPPEAIDEPLLRRFMEAQLETRLFAESLTLELKRERRSDNIARSVAAFANTDGGIILLGVDEDQPTFDAAPGVSPAEVVAVADSCRQLLSPPIRPEILPVATGRSDSVILVIRVPPEPTLQPVLRAGTVLVRAPGQTLPASRQQVIDLVRGSDGRLNQGGGLVALNSRFYPDHITSEPEPGAETLDARIRVVSAGWLRPSAATTFMMGSRERAIILKGFGSSAFALQSAWLDHRSRFASQRPRLTEGERTSSMFTAAVSYSGNETHRVSINCAKEGPRVAFALDLEIRLEIASEDLKPPRLSSGDVATAVLEGVEAASLALPQAIAEAAGEPLLYIDDVHVWLVPGRTPISETLDTARMSRTVPRVVDTWGFSCPSVANMEEAEAVTKAELTRFFLDIGIDDEDAYVSRDIEDAKSVRRMALETHGDRA